MSKRCKPRDLGTKQKKFGSFLESLFHPESGPGLSLFEKQTQTLSGSLSRLGSPDKLVKNRSGLIGKSR